MNATTIKLKRDIYTKKKNDIQITIQND